MVEKHRKRLTSVSEQVRQLIESCGLTRYRIAQQTGIAESTLSRFVAGQRTLSSDALDKLGELLDLEVVMHGPKEK